MNAARKQQIDEIVRRIAQAAQPEKIVLFGSYARADAGADSDVDRLVIEALPFGKRRNGIVKPSTISFPERCGKAGPSIVDFETARTPLLAAERDCRALENMMDACNYI